MNAIAISENSLYPGYNQNLLTPFSLFNDVFNWTVSAGSGSGSNQNTVTYEGIRALRLVSNVSTGITINSGGTQTNTVIKQDGTHIFSFRKYESDQGINTNAVPTTINIFVNGSPRETAVYQTEINADQKGIFKTYYIALPLEINDVFSYTISVGASDVGSTYRQFLDGFKLEFDKFGIGYPTVYTAPENPLPYAPTTDGLYGLRIASGVATWEIIT